MSHRPDYRSYALDDRNVQDSIAFRDRYSVSMRESETILVRMIAERIGEGRDSGRDKILLDIGCSSGSFLGHLRRIWPSLGLVGGDISTAIIEGCRARNELAGIEFRIMDMLDPMEKNQFDFIVSSAALMFFSPEEFGCAIRNLATALKPGGSLIVFDYFQPFHQDLRVVESSDERPEGLNLFIRSYRTVERCMRSLGLTKVRFSPFLIDIDLQPPRDPSDLNSYTLTVMTGERLCLRGGLLQPWCHLIAERPADADCTGFLSKNEHNRMKTASHV